MHKQILLLVTIALCLGSAMSLLVSVLDQPALAQERPGQRRGEQAPTPIAPALSVVEHRPSAAPVPATPAPEPAPVAKSVRASARPVSPATPPVADKPAAKSHQVRMLVTAYCPCCECCGDGDGVTASGKSVRSNGGKFVAADTSVIPMYTKLTIPGYAGGKPVPVLDRGGAIKGNRLDVYFPTHKQALQWGRQWVTVTVWD